MRKNSLFQIFGQYAWCLYYSDGLCSDIYLHLSVSPIRFPAKRDFLITFLRSTKPPLFSQSWTKLGHLWRHLPSHSLGFPHGLCLFLYKSQNKQMQRCIWNPAKHLRWSVFEKYLTTVSCFLFSLNLSCLTGF